MLTLGIIGAGRIGKVHGESIAYHVKNARVKTIADPMMNDETRAWAASVGIADCQADYQPMLADPEIDAVLVCSSTNTHARVSIDAIRAGKHVFCEKPVSMQVADILEVQAALAENPVTFQVGFNRRYDHNFEALRAAVLRGHVGEVHIVKITSRDPAPPPPAYVKVSGGIFLDMTIHDFDMARYLTGSEVESVSVAAACLVDPEIGAAGDVDTAIITLRMANGALAVIDNSRKAAYGYDQRAEVFGSKGMAANSNDAPSTVVLSNEAGVTGEKPLYFFLERYMASFTREIGCFVNAVEKGEPVPVTLHDGLQATRIGSAAGLS